MAADETSGRSTFREYYEALLIAIIFVNFVRLFAFQVFKIPSGSMEDNLKVGDHIVVNKFIYGPRDPWFSRLLPMRDPARGDIVIFRSPEQPKVDYVKRVVGLPGERIAIKDKKVLIEGRGLDEPYTVFEDSTIHPGGPFLPEPYRSRDQMRTRTIPEGSYFVLGDRRDFSNDSRYWGTVPREMIRGRAFMVYWSFAIPPPRAVTLRARLTELGKVLLFFFTETRWERTFFIVDSEYHKTPLTQHGNQ